MSAPPDRPLTRRELREAARRAAEAAATASTEGDGDLDRAFDAVVPQVASDPEVAEVTPDAVAGESESDPASVAGAPEGEADLPEGEGTESDAGEDTAGEEVPDEATGADDDADAAAPETAEADTSEKETAGPDTAETETAVAETADAGSGTEDAAAGAGERADTTPVGHPADDEASTVLLPAARRRRDLATSEPPPPSRAGRNLPVATGVGLGLGGLLLVSLFIRPEAFVVLAVIAAGGGLWEFAVALRAKNIRIPLLPLLVGSTGMLVSAYVAGPEALVVAFMLTAGGVFVWRVIDGGGMQALRDAGAGILAAAYIPFLTSFAVLMIAAPDGAWRVLYAISLVVANDVGGYAAGVLFGKHPMAPTISPKKSWEGAAGSVVLAAVVGVGLMWWFFDGPLWTGAVIGLFAVAAATVGDLSESLIKRDLGLKDMGTLLPGHGGILDRLDSMLVAAPVVYGSLTLALAFAA